MIRTPDMRSSERAFLGAAINGACRVSEFGLNAGCFSDPLCRKLFTVCVQQEALGNLPDLATVLDVAPDLDADEVIALTQEAAVEASLIKQHARNVLNAKHRGDSIKACTEAVRSLQDKSQPFDSTVATLRIALDRIAAQSDADDSVSGTDCLVALYQRLFEKTSEPAIPTGITRLDKCLHGGLRRKRLLVIGARPFVGKSALINTIFESAVSNGNRALLVTLEMSEDDATDRAVALASNVSMSRMDSRSLSGEEIERVLCSFSAFSGERFEISTTASTPSAVKRIALRMMANGGLDLICVDYLQLMSADEKTSTRSELVGAVARELKRIAIELNVPVVTASQCNRLSTAEDRAPKSSELREGAIENDADIIILMHTPEVQVKDQVKPVQLIVAKNRQTGKLGTIDTMFDGDTMRYCEMA